MEMFPGVRGGGEERMKKKKKRRVAYDDWS